jgi:deazaflavin-dependent oxidoreductase (nitroreductase family)
MAFVTSKRGTRGMSGTWLALLASRLLRNRMVKQHRKQGDTFRGGAVLYLSTVGAKTGQQRMTPLGYVEDGEKAWFIIASLGGSARNPAWYHNIAANPDKVSIEVGGKHYPVTPEQLDGERRAEAWQRIVDVRPGYAQYQDKTDRVIPVIRLAAS